MIGFKLPVSHTEWPLFWANFHRYIVRKLSPTTRKVQSELIDFALAPYNAKVIVLMMDGTSDYLNEKHYGISTDLYNEYFVEFEREADMIYFKMEWS